MFSRSAARYAGGMETKTLPPPACGQMLLVVTPAASLGTLFEMAARMALAGPLIVFDGGNCFQGYGLARSLRRQLDDSEALDRALHNVLLSRVFTCYQMETLLSEGDFESAPILVLDFLATFYDQGVRVADRRRLLELCLGRLQAISKRAPVAVWVRQRPVIPQEGLSFLDQVRAAAGQVFSPMPLPARAAYQPALFST
jgi:hypothetical protein